jgi:hypothetical protein
MNGHPSASEVLSGRVIPSRRQEAIAYRDVAAENRVLIIHIAQALEKLPWPVRCYLKKQSGIFMPYFLRAEADKVIRLDHRLRRR